ncbi:MAG: hypothetical protein F4120_11160 [Rhodothermaceae bacterium]|nr:hypothetical protein [Rhodothermaceae bacterium]MXW33863.1 hypothetical protein [Rhodothermaceae bacterium]MYC04793.1 hypothetical protein [Rhodothermaceae bacterium]MYE62698.1 hypothetical protein [Rhodothermaceae bacterium]MYI18159.1 hypothetical protein [Rhodothermaceae bacterium]
MKKFAWFIGSFVGAIAACLAAWWFFILPQAAPLGGNFTESADTQLLNMQFPLTDLTDATTGEPVTLAQASFSDAVIIILGGIGCSRNQVEVLKRWNEYDMAADSTRLEVMTLYADPLMGVEVSRHESRLLRRASEVDFLSLVYEGEEFNPRAMGIQTPQTVRVRNGRIVEILQ